MFRRRPKRPILSMLRAGPAQSIMLYGRHAQIDVSKFGRDANGRLAYQIPSKDGNCWVAPQGPVLMLCCEGAGGSHQCVPLPIVIGPLPSQPTNTIAARTPTRSGQCFVTAGGSNHVVYLCCDSPDGSVQCVPLPIVIGPLPGD